MVKSTEVRFSTPDEYLAYIQQKYARIYPPGTVHDEEFERITREELEKAGQPPSLLAQFTGLELAVERLKRNLLASFNDDLRNRIQPNVAIGLLPAGEANAFIIKSPEGHFAVVLAAGLMLLLHKYFKLVRAFISPQDVIHCNRKSAATLTKKDIHSYIVDLVEIYKDHGAPYGPMVKLSPSANIEHSFLLNLAERFIMS